ncbi:CENPBD1 [Cordylochernes scorpioides]|uniref:CENPBD1 n=1 Tax=Cordylochernes scorpioides TaxID=51811 RepID=A0ABY6KQ90_9ARAC|nr:CENPBD1 [Cordylochernes scorpioides]
MSASRTLWLEKTFLIETSHRPLVSIFTTKDLNDLTPRLQRYRMRMLQFSFHIFHTPGKELITADVLSRQPLPDDRLAKIALNQKLEPTLQNVAFFSQNGWPAKCQGYPLERSFYDVRDKIGGENGLLMRGLRVIIPSNMRKDVLNRSTQHEPLIPNDFPERPLQKFGMDLFHYEGSEYLVVVDYFSRFIEVVRLTKLSLEAVVDHCKAIFARHGILDIVISDKGPQFRPSTTSALTKFASEVGFRHITSSPKHSQSNSQAEAAVKIEKFSKAVGLAATTVRTIRDRDGDKIREAAKFATSLDAKMMTRTRSALMIKMESLLSIWIENKVADRIPLIVSDDNANGSENETFEASQGWFERFKVRANLHSIALKGESASADITAAERYPTELKTFLHEGGYDSKQVLNVDETGLFWKRLPDRTFISKTEKSAPGFKASKDRLTLLLGGNANGDFKFKPFLIYKSENPRAMKDKPTMLEFWKKFSIMKAIKIISDSWEEVKPSCMNGVWRKIWPECVHRRAAKVDGTPAVRHEISNLARESNFEESGYICGKKKTWRLASGRVDDPAKRCQESLTSERPTSRCKSRLDAYSVER